MKALSIRTGGAPETGGAMKEKNRDVARTQECISFPGRKIAKSERLNAILVAEITKAQALDSLSMCAGPSCTRNLDQRFAAIPQISVSSRLGFGFKVEICLLVPRADACNAET